VSRATPWPDDWRPAGTADAYLRAARRIAREARRSRRGSLGRGLNRRTARINAAIWRRLTQGVQ
jgi:hypothetical protein